MLQLHTEILLLICCGVVILSYFFSYVSKYIRIPSVLLLLFAGVLLRWIADKENFDFDIPYNLIAFLGEVGIVMIVLEAGLDLKVGRNNLKLIRNSFLSALLILVISFLSIAWGLHYWLNDPFYNCLVYALPLSIMSSAIVIPSIHALSEKKKEFLIYEASFSDVLGILAFNYMVAQIGFSIESIGSISLSLLLSAILTLFFSFLLFFILAKSTMQIRFFLVFSLLTMIYAVGNLLQLPALLMILAFGLLINNWEKVNVKVLNKMFTYNEVSGFRILLHQLTTETSFIVRTFFFILFGFSIRFNLLLDLKVVMIGSIIVVILFLVRLLYLRLFLRENVFPEVFFIPRGLITIVLFYKIPDIFKLSSFNEGILFFVILATGAIMTIGMMFYKKAITNIVEETQFQVNTNSQN